VNTLYSRNNDLEEEDEPGGRDREMTLGTSFIIGIFFVLVLICAIFFAFGYSLGRRSALPASGIPIPAASTNTDSSAGPSKPASGVPEAQTASPTGSDSSDEPISPETTQDTLVLPAKPVSKPISASRTAAVIPPGATPLVVQVAAVSRQGDAAMLMSALKRKGYDAAIHQMPQDKLLHVQIGPFPTKKDAEAMRQRLISDGYNAIVK
jgi:DedD protein